ncbi:MAG: type I secretion system permease/ATPase [Hyphomicrobiales bacterium]
MAAVRSSSIIGAAVRSARGTFIVVALLSGVVNLLALTGSVYMMQIYDRVMSSHSVPTLVALSIIAAWFYLVQGVLEVIRSRILVRVGMAFDENFATRIFKAVVRLPLRSNRSSAELLQPVRDLDSIRTFLSGSGPVVVFDLPWMPIYLVLIWLLHPYLGILAFTGALLLCFMTWLTDRQSESASRDVAREAGQRMALAESGRRNAEILQAMGLTDRMAARWSDVNFRFLKHNEILSDVAGGLGGISKMFRYVLQSAVLGLGAYLVLKQELSGGAMIGASIIMSRALAPVELAIANWKSFVAARQSAARLNEMLAHFDEGKEPMSLASPVHQLSVEGVYVAPPGSREPTVTNATFKLSAGQGLGIVGPSAAGKSTLARGIVGVWPLLRGDVRLDGAALDQWKHEILGSHIGYLPQDIELFDGTIAENIARFDDKATSDQIVAAARAAGVHDMILRLEKGYETRIGEAGGALSAGQRQRIGLARALYGNPFLVVLDEPNSNLDSDGDNALTEAIKSVRVRNGIVIVIAHRPSAIASVDLLAFMANGQIQAIGPKEDVLRKIMKGQQGDRTVQKMVATAQSASPSGSLSQTGTGGAS